MQSVYAIGILLYNLASIIYLQQISCRFGSMFSKFMYINPIFRSLSQNFKHSTLCFIFDLLVI